MLFNQFAFWLIFIPVIFIYYYLPSNAQRYWLMLVGFSYAFFTNIASGVVLIGICILSFWGARLIEACRRKVMSKVVLAGTVGTIILILVAFKYRFIDIQSENIVIPLGISFYSLRAIGYLINTSKGQKTIKEWSVYATVLSFFPLLPSGPIERESTLCSEIVKVKKYEWDNICKGIRIFGIGLFLKVVLADRLAIIVDNVYSDYNNVPGAICLVAVFAYSFQIYCDFCGYSYMAVGISKMMDIDIMDNFCRPYLATDIREFWKRWHISLSSWLRDYIYIPLGGNRKGKIRQNINIIITFIVSGLWHGNTLNFVVWGGLHGLYQVVENVKNTYFSKSTKRICKYVGIVVTISNGFICMDFFSIEY